IHCRESIQWNQTLREGVSMKRAIQAVLVLSIVALASTAFSQSLVNEIKQRGELRCGVNANLPGFGFVNEAGDYEGFDIDFCKAIAAAVLGDANAVVYRPLTAGERPTALQSGEIDVLIRHTTWTSSRESDWGANFAPTTYYDGQEIGRASCREAVWKQGVGDWS